MIKKSDKMLICIICGAEFTVIPCRLQSAKYCSNKCKFKSQDKRNIEKECPQCKKVFYVSSCFSWRKYCSYKCRGNAQTEKGKAKYVCIECGREFFSTFSKRKYKNIYCSWECYSQRPSYHNPRWNGGTSKKPYPFEWQAELKDAIRKRDEYKCFICGCPQQECLEKLSIHHIDYDKNNLDPKNLISLCKSCHSKTGADREFWQDRLHNEVSFA